MKINRMNKNRIKIDWIIFIILKIVKASNNLIYNSKSYIMIHSLRRIHKIIDKDFKVFILITLILKNHENTFMHL
jgi:hypothetical protein